MTKTSKRILSVTLKRILDDSPDTSYYGEYSQRPSSRFSIDRAHAESCASLETNHRKALDTLERVLSYVTTLYNAEFADANNARYATNGDEDTNEVDALQEACDTLISLQEDVQACDCGERGDMQRNEYRYFNPSFNYVDEHGEPINAGGGDTLTEDEVIKYTRQDYERMEALNAGHWCFVGVRAEAEIAIDIGRSRCGALLSQTITSGGLWGIESDSERSHLDEIASEQLADLKTQLLALGFSKRAVSQAFKSENIKESE
jgi:hypothetical protein